MLLTIFVLFTEMWGLFSKDPSKDFPYANGERLGQIHLANKTVWTLHSGKHRTTGELVAIFSCDVKDGASATQLDIARSVFKSQDWEYYICMYIQQ